MSNWFARSEATFGDIPLFVDANGAYDLSDIDVFQALDDFGLMMFEQPFPGGMFRNSRNCNARFVRRCASTRASKRG